MYFFSFFHRKLPVQEYSFNRVLEGLELTHDQVSFKFFAPWTIEADVTLKCHDSPTYLSICLPLSLSIFPSGCPSTITNAASYCISWSVLWIYLKVDHNYQCCCLVDKAGVFEAMRLSPGRFGFNPHLGRSKGAFHPRAVLSFPFELAFQRNQIWSKMSSWLAIRSEVIIYKP